MGVYIYIYVCVSIKSREIYRKCKKKTWKYHDIINMYFATMTYSHDTIPKRRFNKD